MEVYQQSTQTPLQQQLMKLINEGLLKGEGPLSDLFGDFNQSDFDKGVTQPALKNFKENILPELQEKFIAGNQVLGSGMRRGQLKASTDLQEKLAQLMYQAKQDQKKNKLAGIQGLLGTQAVENIVENEEADDSSGWWKAAGGVAGGVVGGIYGGPGGAAAGYTAGSKGGEAIGAVAG